jgi:hypothetical protein
MPLMPPINEELVRALVRDVVARHAAGHDQAPGLARASSAEFHPSHGQYLHLVNGTDACLIEPAVLCNHCGYCKTHGH